MRALRGWLIFAAVVKAVDGVVDHADLAAVGWALVAAALILHPRAGFALAACVAFGTAYLDVTGADHHVVAVGWVALCLALFTGPELETALRSLASVIYGFAAVNKLLFGFLSGDIIREHANVPLPPIVWPLAVGAVLIEGWLAVAVLRRWRYTVPVALALHVGIVVWSGATSVVDVGIAVMFNGLLVALVAAVSDSREVHRVEVRR